MGKMKKLYYYFKEVIFSLPERKEIVKVGFTRVPNCMGAREYARYYADDGTYWEDEFPCNLQNNHHPVLEVGEYLSARWRIER